MTAWQIALLLIAGAAALGWSVYEFLQSAQEFIAPENADAAEIERRLGKDTPEGRAALKRRFGSDRHWVDARTGLAGLGGILLIWAWFG